MSTTASPRCFVRSPAWSPIAGKRSSWSEWLDDDTTVCRCEEVTAGDIRQSDERILSLGSHVGAGRLALFLLRLAEQSGLPEPDGGIGLPPLSQTELGSCVDVSRETVARAMRDWREQGFIRSGWRQTVLLDPEGLRKHARKFMI